MKRTVLYTVFLFISLSTLISNAYAQEAPDSLLTKANLKDNTIFWQQGKLVQQKGGKLYELQEPVQYSNGTIVSPSGQVNLPDGKTLTLKEKHAVSPQGRVVLAADDIFTHNTIVEHERQVVGNTDTRIVVVDGQVVSAGNYKQNFTYSLAQEKKIQLLEQMVKLLEQRSALLEANLTRLERMGIKAYYEGLNKQLTVVDQQLQALPTSTQ